MKLPYLFVLKKLCLALWLPLLSLSPLWAQLPALQLKGQVIYTLGAKAQPEAYLWIRIAGDTLGQARLADMKGRYQLIQATKVVHEVAIEDFKLATLFAGYRDDGLVVKWQLPRFDTPATLFVAIKDEKTGLQTAISVPVQYGRLRFRDTVFVADVKGLPLLRAFVRADEPFQLKGSKEALWVRYFKHSFAQAAPPMDLKGEKTSPTLQPDSTFQVRGESLLRWQKEGLYLIQKDTNDLYGGIGLLVKKQPFPQIARHKEEAIASLVYISTAKEMEQLQAAQELKPALDRYWLKMFNGDTQKAAAAIRLYYRQLKEVNMMFTSYKEGWKTDQGMIYLIFGPPNQISAGQDIEQWAYTNKNNFSKITFTFKRQNNPFTDQHYVLVRYLEYEPIWYTAIEQWRYGYVLKELQ